MTILTTLLKINLDWIKTNSIALQEICIDSNNLVYIICTLCVIVSVLLGVFTGTNKRKSLVRFIPNFCALIFLISLGIIYTNFFGEDDPISIVLMAAVPWSVAEAQSPSPSDYDASDEGGSSGDEDEDLKDKNGGPVSPELHDKLAEDNHEELCKRDSYENAGRLLDENPDVANDVLKNHGFNPETAKDSIKSEVQKGLKDSIETLKEDFSKILHPESAVKAISRLENTDTLDIDEAKKDLSSIIEKKGL